MYTSCVFISFCLLFFSSSHEQHKQQQRGAKRRFMRACVACVVVPLFFPTTIKKVGETETAKIKLESQEAKAGAEDKEEDDKENGPGF